MCPVAFTDTEPLVGEAAKTQARCNRENTIFDAKRFLGRKYTDNDVQEDIPKYHFKIVDDNGKPAFKVQSEGKTIYRSPEQIAALILNELRRIAEKYLGKTVDSAVLTVPASFNDSQRQAIKDAAEIAGLTVLRLINEPTAAAIAYGLHNGHLVDQIRVKHGTDEERPEEDGEGAATEDSTEEDGTKKGKKIILLFDFGGGTFDMTLVRICDTVIEVLATEGESHLGGQDIDNALFQYLATKYDLSDYEKSRISDACEKMKCDLSNGPEVVVDLGEKYERCTRADLQEACEDILERPMSLIDRLLSAAKVEEADVYKVVLVGGSTRIPRIQDALSGRFGERRLNHTVNPDEAVATGAATQAETLSAGKKTLLLLDVNSQSLGVADKDNKMSVVIKRNTRLPASEERPFWTTHKRGVDINIYEGEGDLVATNSLLGKFSILKKASLGTLVRVKFTVDVNGTTNVSTEMRGTTKSIAIQRRSVLSRPEVQRMAKEFSAQRTSHDVPEESLTEDDESDTSSDCNEIPGSRKLGV